jgi:hypothetical protein
MPHNPTKTLKRARGLRGLASKSGLMGVRRKIRLHDVKKPSPEHAAKQHAAPNIHSAMMIQQKAVALEHDPEKHALGL